MEICLIETPITRAELRVVAEQWFGDLVKATVDVACGVMVIGGELHADAEALLLEQGSAQENLWGINLYPDVQGDDWIEFDSMINVRPSQGNRSRSVEDEAIRKRIRAIVQQLVTG